MSENLPNQSMLIGLLIQKLSVLGYCIVNFCLQCNSPTHSAIKLNKLGELGKPWFLSFDRSHWSQLRHLIFVLILRLEWYCTKDFAKIKNPVTKSGFGLWTSYIKCRHLTHRNLWSLRNLEHDVTQVSNLAWNWSISI